MGFSVPRKLPGGRWALTPPFHPCPVPLPASGRFNFLWHYPSTPAFAGIARVYLGPESPELRGIAPCGVRTFLPRPANADGSDPPPFRNRQEITRPPPGTQGN